MMKMKQITPMVPVADIRATTDRISKVLGFEAIICNEHHSYLERDNVALRLIPAGKNKDLYHPNSQMHCYVDVEGIDELYTSMENELNKLPDGHVRPPFNTNYGQREFHVIITEILLISFGEALSQ